MVRNPSFPGDASEPELAAQKPFPALFKVTRHPMMWGFALWGVAHIFGRAARPTTSSFAAASSFWRWSGQRRRKQKSEQ